MPSRHDQSCSHWGYFNLVQECSGSLNPELWTHCGSETQTCGRSDTKWTWWNVWRKPSCSRAQRRQTRGHFIHTLFRNIIFIAILLLGWIQNRFTSLDSVKHCGDSRPAGGGQQKALWGRTSVCLTTFPLTSEQDTKLRNNWPVHSQVLNVVIDSSESLFFFF